MKLQGGLESEAVVSNFGFFGDRLEVGGDRGAPNVLIEVVVVLYLLLDFRRHPRKCYCFKYETTRWS